VAFLSPGTGIAQGPAPAKTPPATTPQTHPTPAPAENQKTAQPAGADGSAGAMGPAETLPDLSEFLDPQGGAAGADSNGADISLSMQTVLPPRMLGTRVESLTRNDAVLRALTNNRLIRARRLIPEIRNAGVQYALGKFDPQFSYQLSYQYSDDPQNAEAYVATGGDSTQTQLELIDTLEVLLAQLQGVEPSANPSRTPSSPRIFNTQNFLNTARLAGELPTGTRYELFYSFDQLRNDINRDSPPSLFYPEFDTGAGFRIVQPLLKGFGPASTMAEVRIARADRRIGWLEWRETVEQVVAGTLASYIDLALGFENLAVREENIRLAMDLAAGNRRRAEMGRMSDFDVIEALSAAANRREDALAATVQIADTMSRLRTLISSPEETAEWVEITPSERLNYENVPIDRNQIHEEALRANTEILRSSTEIQKEFIRVRRARNQVLPEVNLVGGVTGLGSDADYGNSSANAFGGQGIEANIGFSASLPIGNVKERAALAAAKFQEQQTRLANENLRTRISSTVDAAVSRILIASQRVESAIEARKLAATALNAANRMLVEGKTTSFDVLRFQNNLSAMRAQENAAIAEHQRALVALWLSQGTILERTGIRLEEEAWRNTRETRPRAKDLNEFLDNDPL